MKSTTLLCFLVCKQRREIVCRYFEFWEWVSNIGGSMKHDILALHWLFI